MILKLPPGSLTEFKNHLRIRACESIPFIFECFFPLGFVSQSYARDIEPPGFFLNPAGIGKDNFGVSLESEHLEVRQRRDKPQTRRRLFHFP